MPEIMWETRVVPCEVVETMRVFITVSMSRASPWMIRRWVSRMDWVRPDWERSWVVSFLGSRARAMALWPLRRVWERQAFVQPPVAPRKAIVPVDIFWVEEWWNGSKESVYK